MEKIKVYDKFIKELGQYYRHNSIYEEPMVLGLSYCHREAVKRKDKEMLRLMILDKHPYPMTTAILERERRGERLIPDYAWKAMGTWIRFQTDWWLREAKTFEHPKWNTEEEKKELMLAMRRLKELDRKGISNDESRELGWRCRELDPVRREIQLGYVEFVSSFYFRHEYFKGHMPSYKAQARALRDLAGRHLKFAEMFEE